MFKLAYKNLLASKLRLALTTLAIAFSVGFIAGTLIFTASIKESFSGIFDNAFSSADVYINGATDELTGQTSNLNQNYLSIVQDNQDVQSYQKVIQTAIYINDKLGQPIVANGPPPLGYSAPSAGGENLLPINLGSGQWPKTAEEIAIDADTASSNGYTIGEKVSATFAGATKEYTVTGLVKFGDNDSLFGATVGVFEFKHMQQAMGLKQDFSSIFVKAKSGVSVQTLQSELKTNYQTNNLKATIETSQSLSDSIQSDINQGLNFISIGLLLFGGLAAVVGSFIIYNTFKILISQRVKQLAMLRAIGASKRQVALSVLEESLLIGIVSSVIGLLFGVIVALAMKWGIGKLGISLPNSNLQISPSAIFAAFGVGTIVTMLSAILPAISASKLPPIAAIKQSYNFNSNKRSIRLRAIVASITLVMSLAAAAGSLIAQTTTARAVLAAICVGLLFALLILVAPFVLAYGSKLILKLGLKNSTPVSKIALGNIIASPRQAASSASALMIGVSLVVFSSVFIASTSKTVDVVIDNTVPADLSIYGGTFGQIPINPKLINQLNKLDSLKDVSAAIYLSPEINDSGQLTAYIDPSTFGQVVNLDPTPDLKQLLPGQVMVRSSFLKEKGWQIGQELNYNDFAGSKAQFSQVKIVGTYENDYDTKTIMSLYSLPQTSLEAGYTLAFANFTNQDSQNIVKTEVDQVIKDYPGIKALTKQDLVGQTKTQLNQTLGLFNGLLALSILIAVIGIANTLLLSVYERTREIGMLRSLGMLRRQVRSMIRIESLIVSVIGAALGSLLGIVMARMLLWALRAEGLTEFSLPWILLGIYLLISVLVGLVAAIWPARRASRINVLEAIKYE